jgi:pseudouridine synthase
VAQATGLSRRYSDKVINSGQVKINSGTAVIGQLVNAKDIVYLDGKLISLPVKYTTILVNKPVGYVCSRDGQGSPTIYDLIPSEYQNLKHVGRLDKDSSGLVVLTSNGELAHELSHPSFGKIKKYSVELDRPLANMDKIEIETGRVALDNKASIMKIKNLKKDGREIEIELGEGRNRQIRRTFASVGYEVIKLRRDSFGPYSLSQIGEKKYLEV